MYFHWLWFQFNHNVKYCSTTLQVQEAVIFLVLALNASDSVLENYYKYFVIFNLKDFYLVATQVICIRFTYPKDNQLIKIVWFRIVVF